MMQTQTPTASTNKVRRDSLGGKRGDGTPFLVRSGPAAVTAPVPSMRTGHRPRSETSCVVFEARAAPAYRYTSSPYNRLRHSGHPVSPFLVSECIQRPSNKRWISRPARAPRLRACSGWSIGECHPCARRTLRTAAVPAMEGRRQEAPRRRSTVEGQASGDRRSRHLPVCRESAARADSVVLLHNRPWLTAPHRHSRR